MKLLVLWNGGVFFSEEGKNVFTKEQIKSVVFQDINSFEINDIDSEDEKVTVDFDTLFDVLIDTGSIGEKIEIYNEDLVEMGDDFVEVSIIQINE